MRRMKYRAPQGRRATRLRYAPTVASYWFYCTLEFSIHRLSADCVRTVQISLNFEALCTICVRHSFFSRDRSQHARFASRGVTDCWNSLVRREGLNGEGGNAADEPYFWADWASIFSITIDLEPPRL